MMEKSLKAEWAGREERILQANRELEREGAAPNAKQNAHHVRITPRTLGASLSEYM